MWTYVGESSVQLPLMDRDTTERLAGAIASAVSREINKHFSTPNGRSTSNISTHSSVVEQAYLLNGVPIVLNF